VVQGAPAEKLVSLNLEERRKQKADDDAFRKENKAERDRLAKEDYPFKEFRLGPPLPPKIAAPKPAPRDADAAKKGAPGTKAAMRATWPTSTRTPTPTPMGRWMCRFAKP
jgi:hypothetical protein